MGTFNDLLLGLLHLDCRLCDSIILLGCFLLCFFDLGKDLVLDIFRALRRITGSRCFDLWFLLRRSGSLALKRLREAIVQASAQIFLWLFFGFLLLNLLLLDFLSSFFCNKLLFSFLDFLSNTRFRSCNLSFAQGQDALSHFVNYGSLLLLFFNFFLGIFDVLLLFSLLCSFGNR